MKRFVNLVALLSLTSLGACAATPEEMAQLNATLNNMNNSALQQQAAWGQVVQSQQAGMAATQTQNREWDQVNRDGVTVHCIKAGIYITCK